MDALEALGLDPNMEVNEKGLGISLDFECDDPIRATVVWLRPFGDHPNQQRFEVLDVNEKTLKVKSCGDCRFEEVGIELLCGVELEGLTVMFSPDGFGYSYSKAVKR